MNDIKPIYSSAPVLLLKQPQTLVFVLIFLMSRSAWLLSNGTQSFSKNRQTAPLCFLSLSMSARILPRFTLPRFFLTGSAIGFCAYASFIMSRIRVYIFEL